MSTEKLMEKLIKLIVRKFYLQMWLVCLPSAWQQADEYAGVKHRVHEARDGREAAELGVTAQSHGALQQSPMDPTPL